MTYADAIEYLLGIRLFGQVLGLNTIRRLLAEMGNPQNQLRFIHIAGTNGKGSVAAMIHAVLSHAGYRTGLYTSPHLVSFCERFQINGVMIAEADAARWVTKLKPLLDDFPVRTGERAPTFFEVVTALALGYFQEQGVDVVVWETGLGGRLDATNVVTPLVSVITNITFDHRQYLGNTLREIAAEKAGIIKPGVPVVTAASGEALTVIRATARQLRAPVRVVTEGCWLPTPLVGAHQRMNCATAVAALAASRLAVGDQQVRDGLRETHWPGRFQVIGGQPPVVLDGSHNPDGVEKLAQTLVEQFPQPARVLILGVLRDKDFPAICARLAPLAERIYCVPVNSERTCAPADLAGHCRAANPRAQVSVCANVLEAYNMARQEPTGVILIAGSLFLVGEAMARLGLAKPVGRELTLQ